MQRGCAEVCSEQKWPNWSSAPDWGILKGTRTNGQDKATGVPKDVFRHGPKDQLPQTSSSVCAEDYQVYSFLADHLFQLLPHLTLPDDYLMTQPGQPGQRSSLNEIFFQLTGIPANRLGCRNHRVWTYQSKSQRGDDVGQVELRPIVASNGESVAECFVRGF